VIWSIVSGMFMTGLSVLVINGLKSIIYGLMLGLLYRKSTEVPSVKKEKTQVIKVVSCHHCGASIAKGSRFCLDCGKRQ